MPTFTPPIALTNPPVLPDTRGVAYRLFRHYGPWPVGRTVLRIDGVYATYDTPDQLTVASATEVYMGGHVYEISAATATALTNAGYGEFIS